MSVTASLYAPEPGTALPAASAPALFVSNLRRLLQGTAEQLEVRTHWLQIDERRRHRGIGARIRAGRRTLAQLSDLLADRSRYLIFTYPLAPFLAHHPHAGPPAAGVGDRWAYRALSVRARLTGKRIIVVVYDLPIDRAEGRAAAGGPSPYPNVEAVRAIERILFRSAYRLMAPAGLVEELRNRYQIRPDRLWAYRRHLYLSAPPPQPTEGPDFDGGAVNFFYSGCVDSHVAPNFREILRSIRNAPQTRLHVCGPGAESVRAWLSELDVPNARHYGQLSTAQHDWLAQKCDVGLILYPTEDPYSQRVPTMKYSAYLANGLAVLSTDLRWVAENIRRDGVGQAMPIAELSVELLRWATRRALWSAYRRNAKDQAASIRSGDEWKGWVEELAQRR